MRRRPFLLAAAGLACPTFALRAADDAGTRAVADALRAGGVVIAFRHANAPGTFDPPGFRPDLCGTQRNLDDVGREQSRRIGAWFREQGLKPLAVRSSLWCRCQDTAKIAFGAAAPWPPLNSFIGDRSSAPEQLAAMRDALGKVPPGRFEVWVTHQVNLSGLTGVFATSGEGLVLRPPAPGAGDATVEVEVVARLRLA